MGCSLRLVTAVVAARGLLARYSYQGIRVFLGRYRLWPQVPRKAPAPARAAAGRQSAARLVLAEVSFTPDVFHRERSQPGNKD